MQSLKLSLFVALSFNVLLPFAHAEDWYAEGFIGGVAADPDTGYLTRNQLHLPTIGLRGGYQFSPNFGVEGEIQTGVASEETFFSPFETKIGLRTSVALFGKYTVPVNERFGLHFRAGIASSEFETKYDGERDFIDTYGGLAYGLGGTFDLTEMLYLRGDLTRYDSSRLETDSVSLGAGIRF